MTTPYRDSSNKLRVLFEEKREVTLELRARKDFPESVQEALDTFVMALGLNPIATEWVEVSREIAVWIVTEYLHKDLAYSSVRLPRQDAEKVALQFFEEFLGPTRFFTNGGLYSEFPGAAPETGSYFLRLGTRPFDPERGSVFQGSWMPLTQATFDTGIVALNDTAIGIVWYGDED